MHAHRVIDIAPQEETGCETAATVRIGVVGNRVATIVVDPRLFEAVEIVHGDDSRPVSSAVEDKLALLRIFAFVYSDVPMVFTTQSSDVPFDLQPDSPAYDQSPEPLVLELSTSVRMAAKPDVVHVSGLGTCHDALAQLNRSCRRFADLRLDFCSPVASEPETIDISVDGGRVVHVEVSERLMGQTALRFRGRCEAIPREFGPMFWLRSILRARQASSIRYHVLWSKRTTTLTRSCALSLSAVMTSILPSPAGVPNQSRPRRTLSFDEALTLSLTD